MEALECLYTRRSIRDYERKEVVPQQLKEILEAAMLAPSAGNEQPWHFIVIDDRKLLKEVPNIHPYAAMAPKSSVGILVCGDPRLEVHKGYWVQDCSAATENILLAVRAIGLGATWLGIYPVEERVQKFRKLCNVPDEVIPFALIPVGYPIHEQEKVSRYKEERIHKNRW